MAPEDAVPEDVAPEQPQPDQPEAEPEIAPAAEVVDTSADTADNSSPEDKAALASFLYTADQLKGLGGVKHAQIVGLSEDQRAAQIMVTQKPRRRTPRRSTLRTRCARPPARLKTPPAPTSA